MCSKLYGLICICWLCALGTLDASAQSQIPARDSLKPISRVKVRALQYLLGGTGDGTYRQTAVRTNDNWVDNVLKEEFEPLVWQDSLAMTMNVRLNLLAADLRRMAIVFQSSGSRHEQSRELKQRIEVGLENILMYFKPGSPRPGNWYPWLINLPNNLGATGLLMESSLSEDLLDRLRNALRDQLSGKMVLTGTNAAWEARNHIYLALLDKDTDRLQRAADYVFRTVRYGTKQGVREDYCYLYHGQLPYAGGYGTGFAQTVAEFIYVFADTPFAISPRHFDVVANLLLEHTRWFLVDGHIDLHVRGRTFKRQDSWNRILEAVLVLAQIQDERREEMTNTALAMLSANPEVELTLTSAGFADRLPRQPAALPTGFRYWPTGEIGVYRQPAYHVGFRQFSERVQDYEYLNREDGGEGEEGWNLAYGFTNILRTDGSGSWYTAGEMRPEIDMEHLPGITSRIGGHPVNPKFKRDPNKLTMSTTGFSLNFGTSNFAGGVGWKDGGLAGFILEPAYGDYVAQKSLHFFPQGFWALGSGITSTAAPDDVSHKPVHTTLFQWVSVNGRPILELPDDQIILNEGTQISLKRVPWLWLQEDSIGVVFPTPTDIMVRVRGRVITAWLDHGSHPKNDRYAYAMLPHASPRDTEDFADELPFLPVRYDGNVHAVKEKVGQSESLVFFKPDTALGIRSASPALVYHRKDEKGGIYTVQNPLHNQEPIKLSVEELAVEITNAGSEVQVEKSTSGSSEIHVSGTQGRIYRFGYGNYGGAVSKAPRYEINTASYQEFEVSASSDPEKTILTVRLPEEAIREKFHLSVHFSKSQRLYDFTEADILDRPLPNTVRYQWPRAPAVGPAVFWEYLKQTHGRFHLYLVTQSIETVGQFDVPNFEK